MGAASTKKSVSAKKQASKTKGRLVNLVKTASAALLSFGLLFLATGEVDAGGNFASSFDVTISGFDATDPQGTIQAGSYTVDVDTQTGDFSDVRTDNINDAFPNALGSPASPFWDVTDIEIYGNLDPYVVLSFNVVNTSPTASVVMNVSTTLPTGPIGPSVLYGGDVSGSILNSLASAASPDVTIGPNPSGPTALWQGFIDGTPVLDLLDGFTLSSGTSANIPTDSAGNPVLFPESATIPGPGVISSIGITQEFLLSPGDTAQFASVFVVVPVPEPASALLAALLATFGGAAGIRFRLG